MINDMIVSKSIEIYADVEKVWKGLTTPEIIKDYLYGTETITDWKVGSEIIFHGEYNGQKYRDRGVVREKVTNELLSYSYWSGFSGLEDKPENYSLVTYTLKSIDEKTTLFTWTQKGFATEKEYEHTDKQMESFLLTVKEVIER